MRAFVAFGLPSILNNPDETGSQAVSGISANEVSFVGRDALSSATISADAASFAGTVAAAAADGAAADGAAAAGAMERAVGGAADADDAGAGATTDDTASDTSAGETCIWSCPTPVLVVAGTAGPLALPAPDATP